MKEIQKTLKIVLSSDLEGVEFVLLDLQGRLLREENLSNGTLAFDLSDLSEGVYLVHLRYKGVARTEKIVIQ